MSSKTKLVFFGNERLATGVSTDCPALRALVNAGYDISLIVTSHSEGVSRSKKRLEIADIAHAYHIPITAPEKVSHIAERLRETGAEGAILAAFGQIIPQEILDIFPKGVINIHPSMLPKLRGSTPIETAILNGLEETGISLMRLVAEMDAGPVYAQAKLKLNGSENKLELAVKLSQMGAEMLIKHLNDILTGRLEPKLQDEPEATYSRLLTKKDGLIDFNESAEDIERKVRAFLSFPRTRAKVFDKDIVITKARAAKDSGDGELVMKCEPGYLEILELIAPSGRTMSGADFKRGYAK